MPTSRSRAASASISAWRRCRCARSGGSRRAADRRVDAHPRRGAARRGRGADFLVFGPVFATDSKRRFGPPRGVGELLQVVARARVPVFALGGIDAGGAAVLFDAGIHRIAGISLFMRGDVATTMRRLARRHATARYTSPSGVFPLSPERESTWP
ncbi:MAG: thiamine phosphate synthase [Acidobacteriota bacterium]